MSKLMLILSLIATSALTQETAAPPDLVLLHGRVFTADPAKRWAEAIAIRGDRIVAVGTSSEMEAIAGDRTRRIDVGGRVIIPGINDAQTHQGPQPESFLISSDTDASLDDIKAAIAGAGDESPADVWISGDVNPAVLRNPGVNAADFDKPVRAGRIILRERGGHAVLFSSATLQALRVRDDVSDPAGGSFERDANKRLTGKAFEYADYNLLRRLADLMDDDSAIDSLRTFSTAALRSGVTSIQNASFLPLKRYEKIARHANVPLRIRIIRFPGTEANGRQPREGSDLPARDRERPLTVLSGTEWVLDGTPIDEGAALRRPYHASGEASGRLNFSPDEIKAMLRESLDANDQLLLSAAGDRTTAAIFDVMKSIPDIDWKSKRVRIERGDGLEPDLIPIAASLGVVVVQNPANFATPAGYPANDYLPLKSLLAANIPLALGSDGALNPFLGILLAATHPARPSEAISREQAVEAYTRGSAYAEFAENEKGTIAAGKLADLAVLSQDIFKVSNDALPKTVSLMTMVGGKIVYDSGIAGAPTAKGHDSRP
jgi:predicted amidohydrolase YtcJ